MNGLYPNRAERIVWRFRLFWNRLWLPDYEWLTKRHVHDPREVLR